MRYLRRFWARDTGQKWTEIQGDLCSGQGKAALEGEPLPISAWTPEIGGFGNSQKQPCGHRQWPPYDGQCGDKALVEGRSLQRQMLVMRCFEGSASLEERE